MQGGFMSWLQIHHLKLSQKLTAGFLILGLVPLAIIALLSIRSATDLAKKITEGKLSALAQIKKQTVEEYTQTIAGQIKILAEDGNIVQAMKQFTYAFGKVEEEIGAAYDKDAASHERALQERYLYQQKNTPGTSRGSTQWSPDRSLGCDPLAATA
jgi:hypothetical protein